MPLEIEALLAPVSDADRAGPDLAYDPQRHEIEQAFEASVSIDTNGASPQDVDVDWRRIIVMIADQSSRTKDVWLAVYLARAGARADRLDVVETGARYLAGLLDRFWKDAHPRLEEYGVEGRTGACDTLASFREFIGPMRSVTLIEHPRHGSFTGEDLRRFERGGDAEPGYGAFRATLEEPASVAGLSQAVLQFGTIETLFRTVDAALAEHAGTGAGASFAALHQALSEIRNAAETFLPRPAPTDEAFPADSVGETTAMDEDALRGGVRSRADVARVLDLAIDYYRRSEPQSPVPFLLARAREWINRDFMEVLEDIAPAAVSDARALLNYRGGEG